MSGFPKAVRDTVLKRSGGHCEICGLGAPDQIHHRRPRGRGGSRRSDTNLPANALAICLRCHELAESRREFALDRGWLVRQGHTPADVPVVYHGTWALLADDGSVFRPPQGRDRCERCGSHVPTQEHRRGCQALR